MLKALYLSADMRHGLLQVLPQASFRAAKAVGLHCVGCDGHQRSVGVLLVPTARILAANRRPATHHNTCHHILASRCAGPPEIVRVAVSLEPHVAVITFLRPLTLQSINYSASMGAISSWTLNDIVCSVTTAYTFAW